MSEPHSPEIVPCPTEGCAYREGHEQRSGFPCRVEHAEQPALTPWHLRFGGSEAEVRATEALHATGAIQHWPTTTERVTHLDSGPRDSKPLCGADGTFADVSTDVDDVTCQACEAEHERLTEEPDLIEVPTETAATRALAIQQAAEAEQQAAEAEAFLRDLIAPADEATAQRRRAERDRDLSPMERDWPTIVAWTRHQTVSSPHLLAELRRAVAWLEGQQ